MATKPSDVFTCATDANFSSGPATGQPTKVNPPGFPAVAQGVGVPGSPAVIEFINKLFNIVGQWITWQAAGSSAGAADAHILETDASGNVVVQAIQCQHGTTGLVVDNRASVGGKLVLLGAAAGIQYRQNTIGDANQDITVAADTWYFTAGPTVDRTYTIRHTGTVPVDGQRIRVTFTLFSGGGFADGIFQREDTTEIARFVDANNGGWAEFEYDTTKGWFCCGVGGDISMTVPH